MSILVRRINRAKWQQIVNLKDPNDACADAITNCLKTTKNDLSVWRINDLSELDQAILALITGSQQVKISKIDFIYFDEDEILKRGLELTKSPGDTSYEEFADNHSDISNLTYCKLGILKDIVLDFINKDDTTFRTRANLLNLLKDSIKKKLINISDLNEKLVANEKLDQIA